MKLLTTAFLTVTAAFPQTAKSRPPVTDAEKIADALRAWWCPASSHVPIRFLPAGVSVTAGRTFSIAYKTQLKTVKRRPSNPVPRYLTRDN